MNLKYICIEDDKMRKVIEILRDKIGISTRLLRKLKKEKKITVNGYVISLNALVKINDVIEIEMIKEHNSFEPENIDIDVVYEDDHMIIINKQPYIVVHPTKGHPFGTIANGLSNYIKNKEESYKIRFANRLDRDTSGLMIVCKNAYSQKIISDQMILNQVEKKYYAIVEGVIEKNDGIINLPIGKINEEDVNRSIVEGGLESITHYKVIERFNNATLLEVMLETGRTHQIRVHLKAIGHKLIGDELYGGNHDLIKRQALHAFYLKFKNIDGDIIIHQIDIPEDINILIKKLRG